MTITPLSGGSGVNTEWGDFSGGEIVFTVTHEGGYVSRHVLRVIPFDNTGTFGAPPAGTTSNLSQEAQNITALLRPLYANTATIAFIAVNQTLAAHTGQAPFAYTFTGTVSGAGSAAGADLTVPNVIVLASRGADGSRWRLTLPGASTSVNAGNASKTPFPSLTGAVANLINYLTGQTNGGVVAVKTNVVTHNGVVIQFSPGNSITSTNKRLRRRFGLV